MRHAYLVPINNSGDTRCQRGGVGVADPDTGSEYELEIGERSNCSTAMMALCTHIDEVRQALMNGGSICNMVLRSIDTEELRLAKIYHTKKVEENNARDKAQRDAARAM
jgi:hypothetical protein